MLFSFSSLSSSTNERKYSVAIRNIFLSTCRRTKQVVSAIEVQKSSEARKISEPIKSTQYLTKVQRTFPFFAQVVHILHRSQCGGNFPTADKIAYRLVEYQ